VRRNLARQAQCGLDRPNGARRRGRPPPSAFRASALDQSCRPSYSARRIACPAIVTRDRDRDRERRRHAAGGSAARAHEQPSRRLDAAAGSLTNFAQPRSYEDSPRLLCAATIALALGASLTTTSRRGAGHRRRAREPWRAASRKLVRDPRGVRRDGRDAAQATPPRRERGQKVRADPRLRRLPRLRLLELRWWNKLASSPVARSAAGNDRRARRASARRRAGAFRSSRSGLAPRRDPPPGGATITRNHRRRATRPSWR
jgi:hypothetical protein